MKFSVHCPPPPPALATVIVASEVPTKPPWLTQPWIQIKNHHHQVLTCIWAHLSTYLVTYSGYGCRVEGRETFPRVYATISPLVPRTHSCPIACMRMCVCYLLTVRPLGRGGYIGRKSAHSSVFHVPRKNPSSMPAKPAYNHTETRLRLVPSLGAATSQKLDGGCRLLHCHG